MFCPKIFFGLFRGLLIQPQVKLLFPSITEAVEKIFGEGINGEVNNEYEK